LPLSFLGFLILSSGPVTGFTYFLSFSIKFCPCPGIYFS
jgi:hypothetical protein